MQRVGEALTDARATVRVIDWTEAQPKGDAADWVRFAESDRQSWTDLVTSAKPWTAEVEAPAPTKRKAADERPTKERTRCVRDRHEAGTATERAGHARPWSRVVRARHPGVTVDRRHHRQHDHHRAGASSRRLCCTSWAAMATWWALTI